MYHCLKFNDNQQQMAKCPQLKEDGHCYYCPCYQSDKPVGVITDEMKEKVLTSFIETAKLSLGKNET